MHSQKVSFLVAKRHSCWKPHSALALEVRQEIFFSPRWPIYFEEAKTNNVLMTPGTVSCISLPEFSLATVSLLLMITLQLEVTNPEPCPRADLQVLEAPGYRL